jgi:hypothetical protein
MPEKIANLDKKNCIRANRAVKMFFAVARSSGRRMKNKDKNNKQTEITYALRRIGAFAYIVQINK